MKKILVFCFIFHQAAVGSPNSFLEILGGSKTHYEVLGLPRDCSRKDVEQKYNQIKRMINSGYNWNEKEIEEIRRAYNILKNPTLRARYDSWIDSKEYQEEFGRKTTTEKKPDNESGKNPTTADTMSNGDILHQVIQKLNNTREYSSDPNTHFNRQMEEEYKVFQQAEALLGGDIDPNTRNSLGETLFALAIQKQILRVASLLLQNKAQPEIQDTDGDNALHLLARERRTWYDQLRSYELTSRQYSHLNKISEQHKEDILTLASVVIGKAKGTNLLTARNNKGNQPLHTAIRNQFPELAALIIESLEQEESVDWNAQNNSGETYLALAIKNLLPSAARRLLENKAKPEIPDKDGNNALHLLAEDADPFRYDHYTPDRIVPESNPNLVRTMYRMGIDNIFNLYERRKAKVKLGILSFTKDIIKATEGTNLLTARNNDGKLPLQVAINSTRFPELAELIIELGGAKTLTEREHNLLVQEAVQRDWPRMTLLINGGDAVEENRIFQQVMPKKKPQFRLLKFFNHLCHIAFAIMANN